MAIHPENKNLVQLNHLYLVVDLETYKSIKDSPFIHAFAHAYEQKNKADNQKGWEGFYIRGKNTYLEIFYPQARYPNVGISGIGLGVDQKEYLEIAYNVFKKEHPQAQKGCFSRERKPWFDYVTIHDGFYYEKHSFWIMAYASECFSENQEDVSREHYNKEKYDSSKPFLDITGFSIALKPEGCRLLRSYLDIIFPKEKNRYVTSEGIKIHVREEDEIHQGIYEITVSLQSSLEMLHDLELGASKMTIDQRKKKAVWTFRGATSS